jgi:DNA-binding XRE family transcriptional regulator
MAPATAELEQLAFGLAILLASVSAVFLSEDVRRMVGRNVRRLRTGAGISQAELANRMGVDRAYVSGLELGQRNPTVVTLWHISRALGSDLRSFFQPERARPASRR